MICLNENDISDWFNHNLFHDFFLIPFIYIYIWTKIGKLLPKNNIESSWKCMRQNREISPQEQYWVKLTKYAFSIGLKSRFFYYLTYFCYYLYVPLYFLVLFMDLYYFSYFLALSSILSAKKFQFQLNELFQTDTEASQQLRCATNIHSHHWM